MITSLVIAFAVNWVSMLGNFNYRRYHKSGYRDGYCYLISSKVLTFTAKFIGILDDFNYKRHKKMVKVSKNKVTTGIALVLIFIFILPASGLILVASFIAFILDKIISKKGD